jgi:hypothetical protein
MLSNSYDFSRRRLVPERVVAVAVAISTAASTATAARFASGTATTTANSSGRDEQYQQAQYGQTSQQFCYTPHTPDPF